MEREINVSMTEQKRISIANTIQRFGQKLFAYVRTRVRTNEDAEDILQDLWYQLSKLGDIDELENVGAWLYHVARNKLTDKYRKKTSLSLEDLADESEDGTINYKEIILMDDSNNPELSFFKELFWKELMTALNELPKKQKDVFILNEFEGFTLREIADQKNENIKTIISRKVYASKHLRNKLNYLYQELNN